MVLKPKDSPLPDLLFRIYRKNCSREQSHKWKVDRHLQDGFEISREPGDFSLAMPVVTLLAYPWLGVLLPEAVSTVASVLPIKEWEISRRPSR